MTTLTPDELHLLKWLGKEDFSQYGECYGKTLDRLVELGLAALLCGAVTASAEPQYTYFCAGEPVPDWIGAITEGPGRLTFAVDAIVSREPIDAQWLLNEICPDRKENVEIYPALPLSGSATALNIPNDGSVVIIGQIVRGDGLYHSTINMRCGMLHGDPPKGENLPAKNCGTPIS